MTYDRSQTGWVMINLMILVILATTLAYMNRWGDNPIPLYGFIILTAVFCLLLLFFYKLRIRIDDTGLHIIYGIGLIHIRIKPERVDRVRVVRNPWYYGMGIRATPRGMLYSISGLDAVEIEYQQGTMKRVRIGSDDCQNLKRFIENKFNVPIAEDDTSGYQVG